MSEHWAAILTNVMGKYILSSFNVPASHCYETNWSCVCVLDESEKKPERTALKAFGHKSDKTPMQCRLENDSKMPYIVCTIHNTHIENVLKHFTTHTYIHSTEAAAAACYTQSTVIYWCIYVQASWFVRSIVVLLLFSTRCSSLVFSLSIRSICCYFLPLIMLCTFYRYKRSVKMPVRLK